MNRINPYSLGYRLQYVPRWVTVPTVGRQQSVAEHVSGVLFITKWFLEFGIRPELLPNDVHVNVLNYAISHDYEEAITGDPAGPSKNERCMSINKASIHEDVGYVDNHTVFEKAVVKLADLAEAMLWCRQQMAMGNMLYAPVFSSMHEELGVRLERFKQLYPNLMKYEPQLLISHLCAAFEVNILPAEELYNAKR